MCERWCVLVEISEDRRVVSSSAEGRDRPRFPYNDPLVEAGRPATLRERVAAPANLGLCAPVIPNMRTGNIRSGISLVQIFGICYGGCSLAGGELGPDAGGAAGSPAVVMLSPQLCSAQTAPPPVPTGANKGP